ncbi:hypothetical protein OSB04_014322 [Centaurea solstitialis]|uniref:Reverse transcriptase domain-containing protein n=1 Tax=Centaurea solstitialis TaxID=347529 RepID=A0AA38W7Y5_9ASTR|nr:hypothetical protein OSB04_014322 [Centaurea solstitialis]
MQFINHNLESAIKIAETLIGHVRHDYYSSCVDSANMDKHVIRKPKQSQMQTPRLFNLNNTEFVVFTLNNTRSFKVDFEKAFDNIRWSYLWEILAHMNFGRRWISWIKGVICTAKVSVLVNGSPTNQFGLEKGVRQGDPLSPYLFILAMEGLIAALKEAKEIGLLAGVKLPNNGPVISSLHYADDAIFLGKWNDGNLRNLMKILKAENELGKSTLNGIGVPGVEITRLATTVGCKEGKIPFQYLGIPIGASMSKTESWQPLLERFSKKLSSWKAKTLSVGGRFTLCKAVLRALGVYFFSLFKAPTSILQELERKRRKFFWGSTDDKKKTAWVAWEKVLNAREKGGLGIGSLRAQNWALLTKWWWRYKTEREATWRKVIAAIHGESGYLGGLTTESLKKGVWGSIAAINKAINASNIPIESLFQRHMGDGSNIKFWLEPWGGSETLINLYPRLADLEVDVNCSLADRVYVSDGRTNFQGCWRREIRNGRELNEVSAIATYCRNISLDQGDNSWKWGLTSSGNFSVASLRYAIDDMQLPRTGTLTLWNNLVPLKVRIHTWRARLDRLPTKVNLINKGFRLHNDTCPLCNDHSKSGDHLFITCRVASEVRRQLNCWWNEIPMHINTISEFFEDTCCTNQPDLNRPLKEIIGQAYFWLIWKGRNDVVFNNKSFNTHGTANMIQTTIFSWLKSRCNRRARTMIESTQRASIHKNQNTDG